MSALALPAPSAVHAFFIMLMGVGIIGALASILSSLLVGSQPSPGGEEAPAEVAAPHVDQELAEIKNELVSLRLLIEGLSDNSDKK